jgi:hypothetical protein
MKDRIINAKKLIPKIPDVKQVILKGNGEKPPIRIIMYPISSNFSLKLSMEETILGDLANKRLETSW